MSFMPKTPEGAYPPMPSRKISVSDLIGYLNQEGDEIQITFAEDQNWDNYTKLYPDSRFITPYLDYEIVSLGVEDGMIRISIERRKQADENKTGPF